LLETENYHLRNHRLSPGRRCDLFSRGQRRSRILDAEAGHLGVAACGKLHGRALYCSARHAHAKQQLWRSCHAGAELNFNPVGRESAHSRSDESNFHPEGATSLTLGSQFRSAGPIGEPNRYAQVLVVLLPLAAFRFEESARAPCAGSPLPPGTHLRGMMLTFSRGAMLTAVVIFGLLVYVGFIRPLQIIVSGLALSVLVLALDPQAALRFASLGAVKTLLAHSTAGYKEPPKVREGSRTLRSFGAT